MMDVSTAYNMWASQYDTNDNKTRDLEGQVLRVLLPALPFEYVLEIGCGTGKNTTWFMQNAAAVTAVDLSHEMLAKAKEKISSHKVQFKQADIRLPWAFIDKQYDLVSFSLVLEHIRNLDHVFMEASRSLKPGGHVYIAELHPYKQYSGTKARFNTDEGEQVVECFDHHISDFIQSAKKYGLSPVDINEFFDSSERTGIPRILTILLKKDSLLQTSDENQAV